MSHRAPQPRRARPGDPALARRLAAAVEGEVLFDAFSRGRYSTDASIYQIEPIGVVVPRSAADLAATLECAREAGVPVLARGAGTSQCGQTVGEALVIDTSRHLRAVRDLDRERGRVRVEPGVVLDELNAALRRHGLWFPIDVSTASRATIGGMAGNNSCGARSIVYGMMADRVRAIDALLADGTPLRFAEVAADPGGGPPRYRELIERVRAIAAREHDEIERRFPKVMRRVGGYNLDSVDPHGHNMARLLVGSEGTLALFTELELELAPIPAHRVLGVCHFPGFYQAMDSTRRIVALGPSAVELVDRSLLDLAAGIPAFRDSLRRFVRGRPDCLLLVEFAGEELAPLRTSLARLGEQMADLGLPGAVLEAVEPGLQREIWELRKAGLNIVMAMKGDGKPISFVEDCAVRLEDLAEYTRRLEAIFARHGTRGTWYAHASVGTLHVRPIINLKEPRGAAQMRAVAEECFAMVREFKGSHSGEHGDGLVRSEFHEAMFGPRLVGAFEELKEVFDPAGLLNPGKIVRPPRMDDRTLFRYHPGYAPLAVETRLDWSEWGGFLGAVEMCNNNGACRKRAAGVMCPSFRVTGEECHLTRGRANVLRLALTGQLGAEALGSEEMERAMALCVGCKACRRECPTGVDMARMKLEFLHHYRARRRPRPRERLIAALPRHAPRLAALAPLSNLREHLPGLPWLGERLLGISARRSLPRWRRDWFRPPAPLAPEAADCVLLADTFSTWFEPEIAHAALAVLGAAGYRVHVARAPAGQAPLCCGRPLLAAGLLEEAAGEARRLLAVLAPYLERDLPVIGLEPSCLLTLRDEYLAILPGAATRRLAERALLLEEFLAREHERGRLELALRAHGTGRVLLHGHCHQKAFGAMAAVERTLALVPGLEVETLEAGCCGMAGAFGYQAEHYRLSMAMAELELLPALRAAPRGTLVVADGTSCRHQIRDGCGREARHVAEVLAAALAR